ncbi:phage tail sheath subtilisin-like domain-containing protein [Geomonas sp. Red32]|uniref:phage tail sheath subtilisin-like domain-containing protein n=1 Tax=Geomonas sp. Red32 TaxID=2912856 RepID=UPI00202CB2F9|nr:phage tail sheath subtilisin-like domain-containing protein [Geomonas sp. Red32]MCM0081777.1 phage tail sheath subtilisin-like domain-containing protein [Geomonas sp. Red32]
MYNNLPATTRKPGVYAGFNTAQGASSLPANAWRVLILAQRLAAGTVAALVPTQVYSAPQAGAYFGFGSPAHLMATIAIRNNPLIDLTVLAVDDAATATKATGSVAIEGPATSTAASRLKIGNLVFEVGTSSGDTASDVSAALATMVAAYAGCPVTVADNAGTLTFTAKNGGTVGNTIPIAFESDAAGITATVTAMHNGAVDPDLTDALTAVFSTRYQIICSQFADSGNLPRLKEHVDQVSGKIEQRGSRFYYSVSGALAGVTTLAAGVNFERSGTPYFRGCPSLSCEVAAAFAGVRASVDDPSMPLDGMEIIGLGTPAIADRLSRTEQETCLHNGVTPIEVSPDGAIRIVRAITNYVLDSSGNPDDTLLDDTTMATLDYVRDVVRTIRKPPKSTARRAAAFRDQIYAKLKQMEQPEILMDVDQHKPLLTVTANPSDRPAGWFEVSIPAGVVPGLHILDETITLIL